MKDLLFLLGVLAVCLAPLWIYVAWALLVVAASGVMDLWTWCVSKYQDRRDNFYIACPVCSKRQGYAKTDVQQTLVKTPLADMMRLDSMKCRHRYGTYKTPGCGADLAPVFVQHPFVRKTLENVTRLKMMSETAAVYVQHLDEERAADGTRTTRVAE